MRLSRILFWASLLYTLGLTTSLAIPIIETGADIIRVFAISDLHVDAPANLKWVERHSQEKPKLLNSDTDNQHCSLLIAGDISGDLDKLKLTLTSFRRSYDSVFFVPGNHELWLAEEEGQDYADSLEKLEAVLETAQACGCHTSPAKLVNAEGKGVLVAPLLSWYHASFDTEPELPSRTSATFGRRWQDFRRCKWPEKVVRRECVTDLDGEDTSLAEHFAGMNDCEAILEAVEEGDQFLTLSHFLPFIELIPEKRFRVEPLLSKVVGSNILGEQVLAVSPDLHLFGHTHIPVDLEIEGAVHVQWPLGSVKEQSRQCRRIGREGPLEIARNPGEVRCRWPGGGERTVWGLHYEKNEREPYRFDLAPWVVERQSKMRERTGKPLIITKDWVDANINITKINT
ncbi:hypothetical protein TrLO_g14398 [Triparma laevis f. longispina]|uniref:Calcineurin-like phosphoesterase domain-containing protein n=1 Tax=Triparma laevis f. longispina TaxID=1714387 RepID=A0A9W6ZAS6_9STRA|nr:hypothetical protein TrLO_g14398 [Triparma laevis f. longispina]